ncbi:MmyB family transcriptional regulator [Streptomyces sp. NPDC054794]
MSRTAGCRPSTPRPRRTVVGDLELDQETMSLPDESGLSVVVYSAPPESAAEDALKLLASWSATIGPERDAMSESRL